MHMEQRYEPSDLSAGMKRPPAPVEKGAYEKLEDSVRAGKTGLKELLDELSKKSITNDQFDSLVTIITERVRLN